jgi:hypothetical protein
MAYETGTATSFSDLATKLVTFLTTVLPVGERWTVMRDNVESGYDRNLILRGPGLAGTEQIFVLVGLYKSVGSDYYNWEIRGATGYNSGDTWINQPGISPACYLTLWNSSIPYWFVGNGRRFIVEAKVSTVYVTAYGGFIIPHALPSEYPYPLLVGANHRTQAIRWSDATPNNKCFWSGVYSTDTSASGYLREPGGFWRGVGSHSTGGDSVASPAGAIDMWPYGFDPENTEKVFGSTTEYSLWPVVLFTTSSGGNVYGELDGVYQISGFANASENTTYISGVTHITFQNSHRTVREFYCSIKAA